MHLVLRQDNRIILLGLTAGAGPVNPVKFATLVGPTPNSGKKGTTERFLLNFFQKLVEFT